MRGRLGALEERQFRLLWIGQSASAVGDAFSGIALAFAVFEIGRSATALGLVLAAYTVGRVVFILAGGVWSDRLSRRRVMIACDLIRGAVQAAVAAALIAGFAELWHLVVAGLVVGSASAFFGPAATGLVPQTVSAGRLQQANALMSTSNSASWLAGPALSGIVVGAFGPGLAFAFDAATFGISVVFLFALRIPERSTPAEPQTFLADLVYGWREVRARSWIVASLVTFSLSNTAIAVFFVLGPVIANEELGGAADWGLAMTISAAGGLAGSLLALRYRPARPLIPSFLVMMFASGALLSLVPPLPAVGIGVAAGSMFLGIQLGNALWETMMQQHVPPDVLSRVSSYDWLVSLVFMPLGFTLAGPLADAIGLDTTLIAAAIVSATANLGVLLVPSVRNLRRLDEPTQVAHAAA